MPENVQGGQTTCHTVGNLEDSRSSGGSPDTEEGAAFNMATGRLEDSTLGRLENPATEGEISTNPLQSFKVANPEGQDLAMLNDEDSEIGNLESRDSGDGINTNPVQSFNIANLEGQDLATLNDEDDEEKWVL
jgi:hypothetical protein